MKHFEKTFTLSEDFPSLARLVRVRVKFFWGVLFLGAGASVALLRAQPVLPSFSGTVEARYASQDAGAVLWGARLAGDRLVFIQTLQYFADPTLEDKNATTTAPRLLTYGRRMLSLNPYDRYGVMYVASVLAYSPPVNRPDEAITLLKEAMKGDPGYSRYPLLLGAIGYTQTEHAAEAIEMMEKAVKDPNGPSMVKSILAGLHKKEGHYGRAAEIYMSLLNARDKHYAERARKSLMEMEAEGLIQLR